MADRKTTAINVGNVTVNSGFASWTNTVSTVPVEQVTGTTVNSGFATWAIGITTTSPEPGNVTINSGFSARDIGLELAEDLNLIGAIGVPDISEPVYRGLIGVTYVFSIGTPPIGATDIVIIGYT